jgi:hypothetical protein
MPYQYTIMIEDPGGDDIDLGAVRWVIESIGLRVRASGPGDHMLTDSALRRLADDLDTARQLVGSHLGEGEE